MCVWTERLLALSTQVLIPTDSLWTTLEGADTLSSANKLPQEGAV